MTMNKQKKENLFGWLLFSFVMLIKICSIVTLYAMHKEHHELPHELHPPNTIKDKKMIQLNPKIK